MSPLVSSSNSIDCLMAEHFKCADGAFDFDLLDEPRGESGFFRFGSDTICYGRPCVGIPAEEITPGLVDVLPHVRTEGSRCLLPFDPAEVVDNLRWERYVADGAKTKNTFLRKCIRNAYYTLRPVLTTAVRRHLQRFSLRGWNRIAFPSWPVDRTADNVSEKLLLLALQAKPDESIPFIWFWPEGRPACAAITHDVETAAGLRFCPPLMDLNDSFAIKSSFQIIPTGRYTVSADVLDEFRSRGFEINVHDWNHDGRLFSDRKTFCARVASINRAAEEYGAKGFRSGALYRNLDWYDDLDVAYDMSVPNVGHLDPQPGGCCTLMPYFIGRILEIPVTTTQDYSLFHILGSYSLDLWRQEIDLILKGHGLASFIVHPDYIIDKRAREVYQQLLKHLCQLRDEQDVWIACPQEINAWWRERNQMRLIRTGTGWEIEGQGKARARIAYATRDGQRLSFKVYGRGASAQQCYREA